MYLRMVVSPVSLLTIFSSTTCGTFGSLGVGVDCYCWLEGTYYGVLVPLEPAPFAVYGGA